MAIGFRWEGNMHDAFNVHANGYFEYGPYADDEGIPHQWMRKSIL